MRIQHNITALSAYRNLTNNNSAVAKNLEKLSSGYKINRAGDDAAGLAISEKMRAQITGLETAQKNANDGISLIQTAEGALTEVHSMLNRMVELANQSANGTYVDDDRVSLQSEVTALLDEIDRISESTNFNGRTLLNGDLGITNIPADAVAKNFQDVSVTHVADAQDAVDPVKGKFTLDLSGFKVGTTGGSTTSVAAGGIKVTLGSGASAVTITNTSALSSGASIDGATLAKDWLEAVKTGRVNNTNIATFGTSDNGNAKVTIDGQDFEVTCDDDGILTFEMINDPTKTFDTNLTVTTTITTTNSADNSTKDHVISGDTPTNNNMNLTGLDVQINQAQQGAVTMERAPVYAGERAYAQGTFMLGTGGVTLEDGAALKIGNETYIFAMGANSKFKDADNVIDLTDLAENSSDLAKTASIRLSQVAANNEMFKVGTDNTTGKVYLTEKGGIDYKKNDLIGSSPENRNDVNNTNNAAWKGLVQSGKGVAGAKAASQKGGLTLQIGDTSDDFNKMTVGINDMSSKALGLSDIDISTQDGAAAAVDKIKAAINQVSAQRGDLGALQNRLEHTINSLSVTTENITAAESRIRDVDMAEEMMAYTKNNILVQASQAMLAQANQIPQGVLQLLQ